MVFRGEVGGNSVSAIDRPLLDRQTHHSITPVAHCRDNEVTSKSN